MCSFVFVGLSQHHVALMLGELADAGFHCCSTGNPGIVSAFPKGDAVRVVTYGGCSCDICGEPGAGFDESAERERYRKKRWSSAKIERAILDRRPKERERFAIFREAFARVVRKTGAVRILAHSFSGEVEAESVTPRRGGVLPLEEYLARGGTYEYDVVYDVRAG